jgi:hypothetical protein
MGPWCNSSTLSKRDPVDFNYERIYNGNLRNTWNDSASGNSFVCR